MRSRLRMRPTEKAEAIAVVASVFMAAGMIAVAVMSGSVAVLAEGIDTCVDIITSLAVMIGLWLSRRHSAGFPYGLYKIENIVTVAIGVLILYSAYELARQAVTDLLSGHEKITNPGVAMATMAVVALVTGMLAWNKGRVGRRENSPSLLADARHSWTDAMASAGIVVGVGLDALGVPFIDSLMALVIAAILGWSGVQLLLGAVRVLLDASIDADVVATATTTAEADPGVREVVRVAGRNSGSVRFLHLTLVPQSDDLRQAEACAMRVRESVKSAVGNVESVDVELVAADHRGSVVAVLLEGDAGVVARDFGTADSYALLSLGTSPADGVVDGADVKLEEPDPAVLRAPTTGAIGLAVAIARQGAGKLISRAEIPDSGPRYVLDANAIENLPRPDLTTLSDVSSAASSLVRDPGQGQNN